MCRGWPCSCCRPVKKIDTHFNAERPWKCLFRDMQTVSPSSYPHTFTAQQQSAFNNRRMWGFTNPYQTAGARRLPGTNALSKYDMPMIVPPGSTTARVQRCMARMKYDYGATWAEQSIHLSFDWEFYTSPTLRVETSGQQWPRSILDVAVGDEHDDPDVTYTFTSLGAWINVQLQFEIINEFGSSPVFEAKLWMFEPEGNQVSSRTGRKLSDNTTFTMTQTGTLEVTIEQLAASTRVAGKINGEDIGWTTTFPAREQWASHGAKLFRESPHFRVGAFGRQTYGPASLNPHNGLAEDGFKIDRLRASAVAL